MAKNFAPIFTKAPVLAIAEVSTANANLDGTGTIASVVDGGQEGVEIRQISVKAEGTTTQGKIRLFLSTDAGVTWELWREIDVPPITPSASINAFQANLDLEGTALGTLKLPDTNAVLGAATHNAETFNVFARGGSYEA